LKIYKNATRPEERLVARHCVLQKARELDIKTAKKRNKQQQKRNNHEAYDWACSLFIRFFQSCRDWWSQVGVVVGCHRLFERPQSLPLGPHAQHPARDLRAYFPL